MSDYNSISNKKYQNDNYIYTNCPLCNSNERKMVYCEKYERLNKCVKCSLLYTNPRLKKKNINDLYDFTYFNNTISHCFGYSDYLADEKKIRKTFIRRIEVIGNYFPDKGTLLDLGCAAGFFVDEAKKRGWSAEGVELSSFMANYAKDKFSLNVTNVDIEKYKFVKNRYDLITMWDTIEHLTDPLNLFKKINLSLKKKGMIVFSTPDVGSFPARITGNSWIGFKLSDEHLTYFSKNTIKTLCDLTGFEIIKWHYLGKYVSPSLFIDRIGIYNKFLASGFNIIKKFLPKQFYINPFDIICVYARKK